MITPRDADRTFTVDELPALEQQCESLQTLVSELLIKNQELRQRLALLEARPTRETPQSCGLR